ncbi:MAG TPA: phosphopantetheine-binding protein [Symbiobacteriaceae bacterium]|jgi:acyl carrier protein|nr:phosphopantetheine-binding protein [Symbiobacteriaceae bacterium]
MGQQEVFEAVQAALVSALGVSADEVVPNATLLGDLGAESIDLLDILFRLERKLGIKVQVSDIAHRIQGGIPDEEFADEAGIISAVGLVQLKKALPQINPAELAGKLEAEKVLTLFTVQNLADMVSERLAAKAG